MEQKTKLEVDRERLADARRRGPLATLGAFARLSGPGWLQSALTLGGGSLSSSLYLGVLAGFSLLWLQPVAMVFGIIMLSAIGYVTLSSGERPFDAINRHVSPVLGWGWALASLLANMVWALPQYSLATGVIQQNLLPQALGDPSDRYLIVGGILVLTTAITWSYGSGGWGVRLYELLLKGMVAVIVACFIGVVIRLWDSLEWSRIFAGFWPGNIFEPAPSLRPLIDDVPDEAHRGFWSGLIVAEQRDVMISAAATAVGINMTFLFPYSLLRRGWGKEFRGLARFDLATGMLIPYVLATSCVVIASATQFHAQPHRGLVAEEAIGAGSAAAVAADPGAAGEVPASIRGGYEKLLGARVLHDLGGAGSGKASLRREALAAIDGDEAAARDRLREEVLAGGAASDELGALSGAARETRLDEMVDAKVDERAQALLAARMERLPASEKVLAATLVRRDAGDLAGSLRPLMGEGDIVADIVFGIGVLGMALSTITLLMLISGFVICEIFRLPQGGWAHRLGCLAAGTGILGPFLWQGDAKFWLAVPTSVFGFMLLPIAYLTFFLLMNQRSLLGEEMPRGARRVAWNLAMGVAVLIAGVGSVYMVWVKSGVWGIAAVVAFLAAVGVVHVRRKGRQAAAA